MMNREAAYDHVKLVVSEWQTRLDIALAETDILEATLDAHPLGDLEWRLGQVDADNFARHFRERHRDMAGPGRNFENPRIGRRADRIDELLDMVEVADYRCGRILIRLPGKFLAHQILVKPLGCRTFGSHG